MDSDPVSLHEFLCLVWPRARPRDISKILEWIVEMKGGKLLKEIIHEIAEKSDEKASKKNNAVGDGTGAAANNNTIKNDQGDTDQDNQSLCNWSEEDLQEIFTSLDLGRTGSVDVGKLVEAGALSQPAAQALVLREGQELGVPHGKLERGTGDDNDGEARELSWEEFIDLCRGRSEEVERAVTRAVTTLKPEKTKIQLSLPPRYPLPSGLIL